MTTLVPVDGSQSSLEAVKYAARTRPGGGLVLLHVAPSARAVDLERGRFLLEDCRRVCEVIARDVRIETRLEVGDPRTKLPEVADASGCDLVVMGTHGVNDMPHVGPAGRRFPGLSGGIRRPVVLVLPSGEGYSSAEGDDEAPESGESEEREEEEEGAFSTGNSL